jgi:hypothetical protein
MDIYLGRRRRRKSSVELIPLLPITNNGFFK